MGGEAWRTKRRWELHYKAMGRWASDGTALRRRPCIYFFRKRCIKKTIEIAWLLFVRWLWWWKETRWLRDGPVVRYRTETFCSIDGGKRPCGSRREGAGEVSGFAYLKLLCCVRENKNANLNSRPDTGPRSNRNLPGKSWNYLCPKSIMYSKVFVFPP